MDRTRWLIFSLFICLFSCIGITLWQIFTPPSDDKLIASFHANRPVLQKLVNMYLNDDQDMWIGRQSGYWVGTSTSIGVPENRRQAYRSLLDQIGVQSIGIGGVRDYAGPHRRISFHVYSVIPWPGLPVKSFVYTTEPLQAPITEGDTQDYRFAADAPYRMVCRPLEPDWYLCLDYED